MDFKYGRGSITIYLALTLTVTMALFFCVIESARLSSLKSRAKAISYMAVDSAFGEFAKPLFEEYGIFAVFTTEADFLSSVKNYAEKNCVSNTSLFNASFNLLDMELKKISYDNVYHITDNDGLYFAAQVTEYEKYRCMANEIKKLASLNEAATDSSISVPAQLSDNGTVINESDSSVLTDMSGSNSTLYKDSSYSSAKKLEDSIFDKISALLKSNLLLLFIDNTFSISATEITEKTADMFPSNTCSLSEEAKSVRDGSIADTITSVIDKGLFVSYIHNSFSSYSDKAVNSDISLKYQREYILSGKLSDDANLLSAALSIVNMRSGFNFTYLLTDVQKRDAAINLANAITFSAPIASQIAAFSILSIWSYAEAILDVRDLFRGKKVPLMKTADTWTLSLEGILTLGKFTSSNNDGSSGYTYDDYLDMCLFTMDSFTMYYRCMDLIQLDICENINMDFNMNSCIIAADIDFSYSSNPLFSSVILNKKSKIYNFSVDTLYGYN